MYKGLVQIVWRKECWKGKACSERTKKTRLWLLRSCRYERLIRNKARLLFPAVLCVNLGLLEGKARRQECISESLQGSVAARVTNCHSLPRIEGFPECGNVSAKTTTVPGKLKQPRSPWVVPLDRGIQSISWRECAGLRRPVGLGQLQGVY